MFHSSRLLTRGGLLIAALILATGPLLAFDDMDPVHVSGAARMTVTKGQPTPLDVDLSVTAVAPGGGQAQGYLVASVHSNDPVIGIIRLVGNCKSVKTRGARTVLGGLGSLEFDGLFETAVPWNAEVIVGGGTTEVSLSFVSPTLGRVELDGSVVFGAIDVGTLPAGITEAVAYGSSGVNDSGDSMSYSFASWIGPTPADGFGQVFALVTSAAHLDGAFVEGVVTETRVETDEAGEVTNILQGTALVHPSDDSAPVAGNFTMTVTQNAFGPDPSFFGATAGLEVLDIKSDDPILCLTGIQSDDPVIGVTQITADDPVIGVVETGPPDRITVSGAGLLSVTQGQPAPLEIDLSVTAAGPGGGPAQGYLIACISSDDPVIGVIRLVGACQSVAARGPHTVLGGLGMLEFDGGGQGGVPWNAQVMVVDGTTHVSLSFVSPSLGRMVFEGSVVLGAINVSTLPAMTFEAVPYCTTATNTSGDLLSYSLAAWIGPEPTDGSGQLVLEWLADNEAPQIPSGSMEGVIDNTQTFISEGGEVTYILKGTALVYLPGDPLPVLGTFTLTVTPNFFGPDPSLFGATASLEVLEVHSDDPILCLTGMRSGEVVFGLLIDGDAT